jgi:hypothetical protein
MPARFEADRIFLDLAIREGDTLVLYTDTGGGLFVYGHALDRIDWNDSAGVRLGDLALDVAFPEPLGTPDASLPIFRPDGVTDRSYDGMLGQAWFADRIWTFDYPSQKVLLHESAPSLTPAIRTAQLGFRTDSTGARVLSFPRISTVVDGDTLEMLFDTGATLYPTAEALGLLGGGVANARATSFITTEILNRWRTRNPDWRVVPDADEKVEGMTMIEVPEVSIAGLKVGPVWFVERPDANFHEFMSQWMDRRVDGALGGNVFRFFRVTVDYPAAVAHFATSVGSG